MQVMYTPDNIVRPYWQPNDYQYAGALIAIHSRYSYNPVKKYDLQTELVMGIIGPSALAYQTQAGFHRLIHYIKPMGWSHQFRNDALLNVNLTAEKQLAAAGHWLTLIGGGQVYDRIARAALLGARGNSGVILSQLVRGAAEELISRRALAQSAAAWSTYRSRLSVIPLSLRRDKSRPLQTLRQGAFADGAIDFRCKAEKDEGGSLDATRPFWSIIRKSERWI